MKFKDYLLEGKVSVTNKVDNHVQLTETLYELNKLVTGTSGYSAKKFLVETKDTALPDYIKFWEAHKKAQDTLMGGMYESKRVITFAEYLTESKSSATYPDKVSDENTLVDYLAAVNHVIVRLNISSTVGLDKEGRNCLDDMKAKWKKVYTNFA